MRKSTLITLAIFACVSSLAFAGGPAPDWNMNATVIEACSCPMFCQCYFNSEPAEHGHGEHGGDHYCKFNLAFHVNSGHFGDTSLEGVEFWLAGDLGDDFSDGVMNWAVMVFDPSVTEEQRAGVQAAMAKLFPVEWESFEVAEDADIEWKANGEKAVARLAGGEKAEVVLKGFPGMGGEPVVLSNIQYWGADDHHGIVMMPNEIQTWKQGEKAFETGGTNGFMITISMSSGSVAEPETKAR